MKFKLVKFKAKSSHIKNSECLNCGQPFAGDENFCSYCGQKNTLKKLNFSTFLNNLFSGFLSYDSRFWRTFIPLLTKPGEVSKKFIEGKRARFVNPFQMYLNVSIIFFLVLGISNRLDSFETGTNSDIVSTSLKLDTIINNEKQLDSLIKDTKEKVVATIPEDSTKTQVLSDMDALEKEIKSQVEKIDTTYQYHIHSEKIEDISVVNKIEDFEHFQRSSPDFTPAKALDSLGYKNSFWNHFYYQQVINAKDNFKQIKKDKGRSFVKKMMSSISISLFIFLPIFTLFLWLLYARKKFTYMENLVFVFHTQTVFFLLLTIFYLLNFILPLENFRWIFVVLFLIYLYKAMRYFYQQRRAKTIAKFVLANFFYLFLGGIGITIVGAISFVSN